MTTVAIVGTDGAGKTAVARELAADPSLGARYLYMGANIESANVSLPTSRLILRWKLASYRRSAERDGIEDPEYVSTHHDAHRSVRYGKLGSALRLANRVAEMTYRLMVARMWRWRGYTVVFDRYFALDSRLVNVHRLSERLYHRYATRMSPEPDLVLFLDAPPEVLLARKGEGDLESLERRRQVYAQACRELPHAMTIDASRPLHEVVAEAAALVAGVSPGKRPETP